jgi:hypothetical protein
MGLSRVERCNRSGVFPVSELGHVVLSSPLLIYRLDERFDKESIANGTGGFHAFLSKLFP